MLGIAAALIESCPKVHGWNRSDFFLSEYLITKIVEENLKIFEIAFLHFNFGQYAPKKGLKDTIFI